MKMMQLAALTLMFGASCFSDTTDIKLEGRHIYVNDKLFTVKGVNYSPIPIGASFDDDDKVGDVFFEFFNPVHEVDFKTMRAMGANTIRVYGMFPWHPHEGPKKGQRDHAEFLDLAYNNGEKPIYVWLSYPISSSIFRYKPLENKPNKGWYAEVQIAEKEIDGKKVPVYQYWVEDNNVQPGFRWLNTGAGQTAEMRRQTDEEAYLAIAEKYKEHPAVFGWILGNELNSPQNRANPKYWEYLNQLAGKLKGIAPAKKTMIALIDDGMISLKKVKELGVDVSHIDIWGINSYRGSVRPGLNNFGVGEGSIFEEYQKISGKPLIITEFGAAATTRKEIKELPVEPTDIPALEKLCKEGTMVELPDNAKLAADYLAGHWQDILDHSEIAAGGIVFEWQDEYWKVGHTPSDRNKVKNQQMPSKAINVDFPGGCWDEAGFGINAVRLVRERPTDFPYPFIPDERVPRAAFETLKELWNKE